MRPLAFISGLASNPIPYSWREPSHVTVPPHTAEQAIVRDHYRRVKRATALSVLFVGAWLAGRAA